MYERICEVCKETFKTKHEASERYTCYRCTLKELCGRFAPEEGDFNSALIISGEMTEKQERSLYEDLKAVEEGRSIKEYDEPEYIDICGKCGSDHQYCYCDIEETDE